MSSVSTYSPKTRIATLHDIFSVLGIFQCNHPPCLQSKRQAHYFFIISIRRYHTDRLKSKTKATNYCVRSLVTVREPSCQRNGLIVLSLSRATANTKRILIDMRNLTGAAIPRQFRRRRTNTPASPRRRYSSV